MAVHRAPRAVPSSERQDRRVRHLLHPVDILMLQWRGSLSLWGEWRRHALPIHASTADAVSRSESRTMQTTCQTSLLSHEPVACVSEGSYVPPKNVDADPNTKLARKVGTLDRHRHIAIERRASLNWTTGTLHDSPKHLFCMQTN